MFVYVIFSSLLVLVSRGEVEEKGWQNNDVVAQPQVLLCLLSTGSTLHTLYMHISLPKSEDLYGKEKLFMVNDVPENVNLLTLLQIHN